MRVHLPRFLQIKANAVFAKTLHIDLLESAKKLEEFQSFEELFTRMLKPNARPAHSACVSPADGSLVFSQSTRGDFGTQVKGIEYSLTALCGEKFTPAWFSTVYLAPHNYHRVHSPISGSLTSITYIPGFLWPVHKTAVKFIPQLFCRNERLIFKIKLVSAEGFVYVVMVGAFNVGRISTHFWPGFNSNTFDHSERFRNFSDLKILVGQELGVFELGSTVVVVFDQIAASQFKFKNELSLPKNIRCGETLIEMS